MPETTPGRKYWRRDKVHFPRPVRPLFVSYGLEPVEVGSEKANRDWSIPVEKHGYLIYNGYVYQRSEPLGGDPPPLFARFPALFHLWRIDTRLRRRILGFDRFLKQGGFLNEVFSWRNEWKSQAVERLGPLQVFDRAAADDRTLAEHLEACYDYLCWSWEPHFKIVTTCVYVRGRWTRLCDELFGLTEFEAYELVQNADPDLFGPSMHLARIAQRAKRDRRVADILEGAHAETYERLQGTWVAQEIESFLDLHGDRPVDTYELDPTWREMPELVVAMIKDLMDSEYEPQAEIDVVEARRQSRIDELKAELSADQRVCFDYWLSLTEEAYPLIDTHDYLLANVPASLVRYSAIEAGRRLVGRGLLDDSDDIFFLYRDELTDLLRSGGDPRERIGARKDEHRRYLTQRVPESLGTPPPQPPLTVFPPHVAEAMEILTTEMEKVETQRERVQGVNDEGELLGLPGSPGIAEGTVRVVLSSDDFSRVHPGDVLVCPFTTPSWTVLFPKVAALVTDSGGALSHAAIVAREYGLPSVVGTGCATQSLLDGQRVRVDGENGVVKIIESGRVPIEVVGRQEHSS